MPWLHQIDPIALQVGPVGIHWYGLTYLCAFGFAYWLGARRAAAGRLSADPQAFSDLMFYGMMGVILGGRIGYMLVYGTSQLLQDPLSLLRVWEGGMSFHGGLVGVMIATWWWSRRRRIAFWDTLDFVAPIVPPGLGFGRLGNFIGGELWGKHTDLPWAVIFPKALTPSNLSDQAIQAMYAAGQLNAQARHPSQLYEFLLEGVVMFTVLVWFTRKPRPRYAACGVFALLYGSFRFAIEFVREPDSQLGYLAFGWLTMGQVLSLPLIAIGLTLLYLSRRAPTLPLQPVAAAAAT